MNVLSLFDGMSCGMIALDQLGFNVDNYFASEIDKYATIISEKNYPNIKRLGDVTKVKGSGLPQIDLLIGGSPCQDLSFANEEKLGLEGRKSNLFWEFVRLLKETKPKYFLLENVRMEKKWQDVISKELGVEPIKINSTLVSAQSRNRLYWTNIPNVLQPYDRGILLEHVLERDVDKKYYYLPKTLEYLDRAPMNRRFCNYQDNKKGKCITANFKKAAPYNVLVLSNKKYGEKINLWDATIKHTGENKMVRKLTPLECERLQTLPEGYTEGVSDTRRYEMIGNGWTVEVIKHIFRHMPRTMTAKKPTAWDIMAYQALNPSKGLEPLFDKFYKRKRTITITGTTE